MKRTHIAFICFTLLALSFGCISLPGSNQKEESLIDETESIDRTISEEESSSSNQEISTEEQNNPLEYKNCLSYKDTGQPQLLAFSSDNQTLAILTSKYSDAEGIWFQDLFGEKNYRFDIFSEHNIDVSLDYFIWIPQTTKFLMSREYPEKDLILLDTEGYEIIKGPPIGGTYSALDVKLGPDGILLASGGNRRDIGYCVVDLYDMNSFAEKENVAGCSGENIGHNVSISPNGIDLIEDYKVHNSEQMIRLDNPCPDYIWNILNWSATGRFIYSLIGPVEVTSAYEPRHIRKPCAILIDIYNNYQLIDITQTLYPNLTSEYDGSNDRLVFSPNDEEFALVNFVTEDTVEYREENFLTTVNKDYVITIFDTMSLETLQEIRVSNYCECLNDWTESLCYCPRIPEDFIWSNDGKFVAFIIGGNVKVFDVTNGNEIFSLPFDPSKK